MKCLVSWVTYEPKLRPTMQCQVGLYFLSNWWGWAERVGEVSGCGFGCRVAAPAAWASAVGRSPRNLGETTRGRISHLLLDERGDILLDVVLLEGLRRAVDGVLLHVL